MLSYTPPGEVAEDFLLDESFISGIQGPIGSGKSTAALFKLLKIALAQPPVDGVRRSRLVILRNTSAQLTDTIVPLLNSWFVEAAKGQMGEWKITEKKFKMKFCLKDGTRVDSEWWLMAADGPEDVRRLLSMECTAAWVEEARELHEEVFAGLQGRVGRYPSKAMGGCAIPCVIFSTNPPPAGSYWYGVLTEPPKGWKVFVQPPALLEDNSLNPLRENPHLPDEYYERLMSGKTEEWIDVFLKNKYGIGNAGQPVYRSSFKKSFHVAKEPLEHMRSKAYPIVVGMDNGLTAAAAICQGDARGRVLVVDECYVPKGTTMGVERFLDTMLIPVLRSKYFQCEIVFVLDPACFQRSQRDERTIAQAVQERGYRVQKAVTNDPEKRIGAVETLLCRSVEGQAYYLISPTCKFLIEGFEHGYRYPQKRDGSLNTDGPQKNHFSHLHDANQYAALFFVGVQKVESRPQALPVSKVVFRYT